MSYERAKEHLEKFGLGDRIRLFEVSSATVALAAEALGTSEARIAKTLSFLTPEGAILVVAAGDAKIDNRKFKDNFHTKAKMISHDEVEALVGHAVGGVCPFGINSGVKVYLDGSLRRFDVVYPAAGTASSAVELTVSELELATSPEAWVDVTQIPSVNEE
ncbi:MAG: YbaK/EbsC family protein [Clostridia bacterium]|nr:YbaK/EbsC family protein [Clostridia bacterium]